MTGEVWSPGPAEPALEAGEVHVWRASLRTEAEPHHLACLSTEERRRADRFRFARHRHDFVVARATLRAVLARYLGDDPARLRLGVGAHGKPFLLDADLPFNVAHSGAVVLYAVAQGREVGIDVERVRAGVEHEALAGRFFSPAEAEALRALPEALRTEAFFACWTRKEAFLKAGGEGLSGGLDRFTVSVAPDGAARLLDVRGRPGEAARWSLRSLRVGPGYAAALAVPGAIGRLSRWRWEG